MSVILDLIILARQIHLRIGMEAKKDRKQKYIVIFLRKIHVVVILYLAWTGRQRGLLD